MTAAEARQRIEGMAPAERADAAAEMGRLCVTTGALQREFGVPLILGRLLARKLTVHEYAALAEKYGVTFDEDDDLED